MALVAVQIISLFRVNCNVIIIDMIFGEVMELFFPDGGNKICHDSQKIQMLETSS